MTRALDARSGTWRITAALLAESWRLLRTGGARLAGLLLVSQLLIVFMAMPISAWLFREALRASGLHGFDLSGFRLTGGAPLTLALLIVIAALAFMLVSLQFTAIVTLLRWPGIGGRAFLRALGRTVRRLMRPGSLPLLVYLFLLLPLTGFGFASALTQGIAIPPFVSGELLKETSTTLMLIAVLLVFAVLNVRLALTVPVFVLSEAPPLRTSWRLTRGMRRGWLPIVLAVLIITALASALGALAVGVALLPTLLTDALAPVASPVTAAIVIGVGQVGSIFFVGFVTAAVAAVLVTHLRLRAAHATPRVRLAARSAARPQRSRRVRWAVTALAGVVAVASAAVAVPTVHQITEAPSTLVLGHRGFVDGGVENTISALDAAKDAGADLVEMDVMQTADGRFVVMHDANLNRLADRDVAVKDLTLAELTEIEVHDQAGHSDLIPALSDYVLHAQEIGMPLLIEIKMGGLDTPDHVDRLLAELDELGVLEDNIFHTLDPASVARVKELRPDLTIGYILPFAGGGVPETPADFIVVEEWTATEEMQQAATDAGLGFMVWTVNEESSMRQHLRRDPDGLITDHPDTVLRLRDELDEDPGVTQALLEILDRFVTIG